MNTTSNYNFEKNIRLCAVDSIDRELKRVENQTHSNAAAIAGRYTKEEVDRMLAGKADRCAHRDPCRKPDHCCDRPVCECDCYTKEEVDSLLENKANMRPLTLYDLPLSSGYAGGNQRPTYSIDQFGLVRLFGRVDHESATVPAIETFAILPDGFRPKDFALATAIAAATVLGVDYYTPVGIVIYGNGQIQKRDAYMGDQPHAAPGDIILDGVSFQVSQ